MDGCVLSITNPPVRVFDAVNSCGIKLHSAGVNITRKKKDPTAITTIPRTYLALADFLAGALWAHWSAAGALCSLACV